LTPQGQAAVRRNRRGDQAPVASWEELDSYTRCISRVMPRLPQNYNHGTQIVQTPDLIVLRYEQLDTRLIVMDGRRHLDKKIRHWNGDSRGHWEGDTLVVDTTNFTDKQEFRGIPQGGLHLVERFTRVDADTINYEVTIDDPKMWTRPWKFLLPWRKDDDYRIFEYACHEGNYGIEGILASARADEQAAEEAAQKSAK
jgi:hypothetical protein